MKRLSFIVALAALVAVGGTEVSAQGRRDRGDRGWERREQQLPMAVPRGGERGYPGPAYPAPGPQGSGRYREALRQQQQQQQQRGWGRGDRLPPGYGASIPNPGVYRLRQPPPGYVWMRNGRDLYLMQQGTGLVLDAIPGGF